MAYPRKGQPLVDYGREVETEIDKLYDLIEAETIRVDRYSPRWLAIKLLEEDADIRERVAACHGGAKLLQAAEESVAHLRSVYGEDADASAQAFYEMSHTLSVTMSYRKVLDTILKQCRRLLDFSVGVVLLSAGRETLFVAAASGLRVGDADVVHSSQRLFPDKLTHPPSDFLGVLLALLAKILRQTERAVEDGGGITFLRV